MVLHNVEHIGVGGVQADSDGVVVIIGIERIDGGGIGEIEETRIAMI